MCVALCGLVAGCTTYQTKPLSQVSTALSQDDLARVESDPRKMPLPELAAHRFGDANLLPSGVYYELGGLYQQQQIAFRGLLAVFGAAVALVFGLLLFLYERLRVALAVMAMPLCATGAVFIGLWVTGIELNISAMMGMTMIVGIVTEVAIFYVSEFQALVRDEAMAPDVALLAAGRNRCGRSP
ncbi:hypothetical protein NL30_35985 [Burkholderia contaminans]|nr:hypothetical protein NL30_35985 [Burkholderia contaminans]